MQAYLGGTAVSLTIPLVDADGECIVADSVEYRVIDQNEVELVAKVALAGFTSGDDQAVVEVSSIINTLPLNDLRGMRVVELYALTLTGTIKVEQGYFIEAEAVLVEGVNSFQSYSKAVYSSYEIPAIQGWGQCDKSERVAALIAARRNIGHLRFLDSSASTSDITELTQTQWAAMPVEFKAAVCRAQIIEADYLLGGDPYGEYRRAGVMSMTVGEAKQFFRPAKAIEGAVCARAMKELSKYILIRTRIARG